jgi:NAD(P)-dependent dehydrogenase (short-subunit alcohol dehydrogenase family)
VQPELSPTGRQFDALPGALYFLPISVSFYDHARAGNCIDKGAGMGQLAGRRALVVAGAAGIGRACVERFAAEGAMVVFSDINRPNGEALEKALRENGHEAWFLESDAGVADQVRALVAQAIVLMGGLDLLLNNAGIAVSKDFLDLSDDDFDHTVNVNLKSAYVASQAAARHMLASGTRGTITSMSSVNAVLNIPKLLTYNITKGGLNQLTRNLAIRLAPHGIRVNAIGPGTILTDLVKKTIYTSDAAKAAVMSRTPMGRAGEVGEIASIAVFLASEASSYVTGQVIYADGGRLPLNYTV